MKNVLGLGYALFAGAVVAVIVFLAGVDGAGPLAFAFAGFGIACVLPVAITRMANWGVPGDESFGWLSKH